MYPAIALLAARAIGDRIRSFAEPSDIESVEGARPPWWRPKEIVKRVGVGVAIFDVTLMLLVKPTYWTDWNARNARLAFIEDIRAIVSPGKQLFSAPEFDPTDAMIFAYRLRQEITRKPLLCGSPDDYFLLRSDSANVPGVETQVLASSTSDGVSLVAVIRKTA